MSSNARDSQFRTTIDEQAEGVRNPETIRRPPSMPQGYEYLGHIGGGGMAEVFLVMHVALRERRALKVIDRRIGQDPDFVRRFEREQRIAAELGEDPHIIAVHDFDVLPTGEPFAILQYFERGSLASLGGLPRRAAGHRAVCSVLADVASALRSMAAHRPAAVVHRDIKPQNILIGEKNGMPYGVLADFGLARAVDDLSITQTWARLLSPAHAAPEQFEGETLTPRTDVYALGVTACETFSGRRPLEADDAAGWRHAHRYLKPVVPRPSDERLLPVVDLIERSLAKRPSDRPHAAEWETTLRRVERTLLAT